MTLLEAVFQLVAQVDDAGDIDFKHAVDVSAGAARFDHALRDDLAHVAIMGTRSPGMTAGAGAEAGARRGSRRLCRSGRGGLRSG